MQRVKLKNRVKPAGGSLPKSRKKVGKAGKVLTEKKDSATGQYVKGNKSGGRKPGVPNQVTTFLKDAFLKAAQLAGDDIAIEKEVDMNDPGHRGVVGYLRHYAHVEPKTFIGGLVKIMPHQIMMESKKPIRIIHMPAEHLVGIPLDKIRVVEEVFDHVAKRMGGDAPKMIEGTTNKEDDGSEYKKIIGDDDDDV